jgi:Mrp family chromosome partitioning ATPase
MILQAKGGVGKSFISAMIAQYLKERGESPLCIDTDPMNQTFAGYRALAVRKLNLMAGDEIDVRNFDQLLDWLAEAEGTAVVDNGAATFVPLVNYLITNQVAALLADLGHELVVHTVEIGRAHV